MEVLIQVVCVAEASLLVHSSDRGCTVRFGKHVCTFYMTAVPF